MAGAKRAARGRAEREERAGYAGSGAGSNRAGRAKSRIRDAGNAVRSLVSTRTGDDMEDWVVFGVSFWWYPVWYSLTTVILGFLGSTWLCRETACRRVHTNTQRRCLQRCQPAGRSHSLACAHISPLCPAHCSPSRRRRGAARQRRMAPVSRLVRRVIAA